MSNVYYGVEPYTGKIICHTGQKGMKWGYTDLGKTLVDRAKVARVKAMDNDSLNKALQDERELEKNDDYYYNMGIDKKISKRQLYKGHSNGDILKNAKNLAAKIARDRYMDEYGSQETKRHLRDIMLNENTKNARNNYATKKGNTYLKKVGRSK